MLGVALNVPGEGGWHHASGDEDLIDGCRTSGSGEVVAGAAYALVAGAAGRSCWQLPRDKRIMISPRSWDVSERRSGGGERGLPSIGWGDREALTTLGTACHRSICA